MALSSALSAREWCGSASASKTSIPETTTAKLRSAVAPVWSRRSDYFSEAVLVLIVVAFFLLSLNVCIAFSIVVLFLFAVFVILL